MQNYEPVKITRCSPPSPRKLSPEKMRATPSFRCCRHGGFTLTILHTMNNVCGLERGSANLSEEISFLSHSCSGDLLNLYNTGNKSVSSQN
ncbi:hypothetical protein CEXT_536081 [Caerostris extrusa]|uniref:Uncharacterized protein n=1 Tax=Caerostris extrusa TaxID=172846 RepID=A0AAV4UC24_CAEEX|nr:hypothetical protein CEXT_536081 [Caerostris extrusa]